MDDRSESVGRKIREAELRKVPYMLVVGEREEEEGTVSVRSHIETATRRELRLDDFVERPKGTAILTGVDVPQNLTAPLLAFA